MRIRSGRPAPCRGGPRVRAAQAARPGEAAVHAGRSPSTRMPPKPDGPGPAQEHQWVRFGGGRSPHDIASLSCSRIDRGLMMNRRRIAIRFCLPLLLAGMALSSAACARRARRMPRRRRRRRTKPGRRQSPRCFSSSLGRVLHVPAGGVQHLSVAIIIERFFALRRSQVDPAGFMAGLKKVSAIRMARSRGGRQLLPRSTTRRSPA